MEDAEFCLCLLQLLREIRRTFVENKRTNGLLNQAVSYASSGHMELSLAAIQALLKTAGNAADPEGA